MNPPQIQCPARLSNPMPLGSRAAKPRLHRAPALRPWAAAALAVALIGAPPVPAADPPAPVLTVAIFDFESKDDPGKELGSQAATLINAQLSAAPDLITVERAELAKILGEQELGLSGTVSTDTAAKVGHLTGAKVLVTGRIFKADKELVLVAKIIGTETSRVYGEMVKSAAKPLTDLAGDLAGKIAATIAAKGETLVAKVQTREDRLAALQRKLGTATRPAVSVKIAERHFAGPTIDPAAETELGNLLTECGFTLLDERSEAKPAFELQGEAFSEYGLRKGNLVSCRARVEIKVRNRATGQLVMVDRQTSVAVDLSEQIAAKSALQQAAAELADRIVPKLIQ